MASALPIQAISFIPRSIFLEKMLPTNSFSFYQPTKIPHFTIPFSPNNLPASRSPSSLRSTVAGVGKIYQFPTNCTEKEMLTISETMISQSLGECDLRAVIDEAQKIIRKADGYSGWFIESAAVYIALNADNYSFEDFISAAQHIFDIREVFPTKFLSRVAYEFIRKNGSFFEGFIKAQSELAAFFIEKGEIDHFRKYYFELLEIVCLNEKTFYLWNACKFEEALKASEVLTVFILNNLGNKVFFPWGARNSEIDDWVRGCSRDPYLQVISTRAHRSTSVEKRAALNHIFQDSNNYTEKNQQEIAKVVICNSTECARLPCNDAAQHIIRNIKNPTYSRESIRAAAFWIVSNADLYSIADFKTAAKQILDDIDSYPKNLILTTTHKFIEKNQHFFTTLMTGKKEVVGLVASVEDDDEKNALIDFSNTLLQTLHSAPAILTLWNAGEFQKALEQSEALRTFILNNMGHEVFFIWSKKSQEW